MTQKQTAGTMKVQQLCRDLLRMQKGKELDAVEAAREMRQRWGIIVDHHEMSFALDYLNRCGDATITKPGGFVRYIIN